MIVHYKGYEIQVERTETLVDKCLFFSVVRIKDGYLEYEGIDYDTTATVREKIKSLKKLL